MNDGGTEAPALLSRVSCVASESFGDVEVVFDPVRGIVRRLNHTASDIWRVLDGACARTEIVAVICARSAEKTVNLEADVLRFVDELMMWGLVENIDG